jgi:ubiquinone/menaquinone biosynthesis C-methylase UbiE
MSVSAMFWDMLAGRFDEQEGQYKYAHIRAVENVRRYLNPDDRVLDYGCATGTTAFEIAGQVGQVQGIDFSSKMIAAAKRNAAERGVDNVDFLQSTLFDRQLREESFDVILALGILHLLKDTQRAIQRINRLLKPGGWFISASACMGEDRTIPARINRILFIPSRIGIFPYLRFLEIPKLEQTIIQSAFQISETEMIPFDRANEHPYIVGFFIAVQKAQNSHRES